jgi:hypothetical protein
MGNVLEQEAFTPEQVAEMRRKSVRMAQVLRAYWAVHGEPATQAEALTQANALYAELYGAKRSFDP